MSVHAYIRLVGGGIAQGYCCVHHCCGGGLLLNITMDYFLFVSNSKVFFSFVYRNELLKVECEYVREGERRMNVRERVNGEWEGEGEGGMSEK